MHRLVSRLSVLPFLLLQAACAHWHPSSPSIAQNDSTVATTVDGCRSLLSRPRVSMQETGLEMPIELLNWNIKKGSREAWRADLRNLSLGKEFVVLQEAVMGSGIREEVPHLEYVSFSQGYTTRFRTTGVATFSATAPVSECRFSVTEPLLQTPKATNIAEYRLKGSVDTLVVVNLHAVNFSLGLGRFREQMAQVRDVLDAHEGPAILSGDFNTWSRRRMAIVRQLIARLGFSAIVLGEDHRKTFNGHALDHVFVRGFSSGIGETLIVRSSDHNPVSVELVL